MEASQDLLSRNSSPLHLPRGTHDSLNRDDHEMRLSRNSNIEDNNLEVDGQIAPPISMKRKIFNNILIVLGLIILFSLPLILFTFLKPVRIIFKVVGNEVSQVGGTVGNYIILCLVGIFITVFGMSTMLFEMIMAYSFQAFWKPYSIALVYKLIGLSLTHVLSKTLLYDRVVKFFESSKHFHALQYLARRKPYKTLFMLRFARFPAILSNYGTPLFGYSLFKNVGVAMLASALYVMIYLFLGLSARSIEELEHIKPTGGSQWVKYVPLMISCVGAVIIVFLFFYAKKNMERIIGKYRLEELKARLARRDISYESLE